MFLVILNPLAFLPFLGDDSLGLLGVFNIFQPCTKKELNVNVGQQ
jgi:hypothetical protein